MEIGEINPLVPQNELELYSSICKNFKVVFDIGCREDIDYYNIHPNCEYHLFEPNMDAIDVIKSKISKLEEHNIIVNEFGISDENLDNCTYYYNTQSFTPHWISGFSKDTGERYSLKTIDSYVEYNKISHIDMIKSDTEGLDYKVIMGGMETIKSKVDYLQIEYGDGGKGRGLRQFTELLLPYFDIYLMMEPILYAACLKINNEIFGVKKFHYFNEFQPLIKIEDEELINFMDIEVSKTGNGGNIFCKKVKR